MKQSEQSPECSKCDPVAQTASCPCLHFPQCMTVTLAQRKGLLPKLSQLQCRRRKGNGYETCVEGKKINRTCCMITVTRTIKKKRQNLDDTYVSGFGYLRDLVPVTKIGNRGEQRRKTRVLGIFLTTKCITECLERTL